METLLITAPTIQPLTIEELKLHLRIELDVLDEDEYLEGLITTAKEFVEDQTGRALLTQTWEYYLSEWPKETFIRIPFGNLQSVTSIKWKDTDAVETTLTVTTDYLVETNGENLGRIVLPYAETWPSGTLYPSNPITIKFICGWTTAALVPIKIKQAIKMICAELYEHRGESSLNLVPYDNKIINRLLINERLWY